MAVYSVLHPFDSNEEDWKSYSQRAKLYHNSIEKEVLVHATDVEVQTTGPQSATLKKPSATIVVRKAMLLEGHAEADQRHH